MRSRVASVVVGLALVTLLGGCVPITYQKTLSVRKDAMGKVIETTETETIVEPHSEMTRIKPLGPTQFDNLK